MATKTVAWNSGNGVITLTYTGQGNGSVSVKSDANDSFDARSQNLNIVTTEGSPERAVQVLVKQAGKPLGWTTKDFSYTGNVQEVTLPKGRYKLQCWGAQGGDTSSYSGEGSYGGYSEGILTLTKITTLYIFVGGRGGSSGNGGWNGGGSSTGYSSYSSGNESGESWPACGGGATDISTVTSSMAYSNGRTNRSAASLLARCIVAGGGAGASAYHQEVEETTTIENETYIADLITVGNTVYSAANNYTQFIYVANKNAGIDNIEAGKTYKFKGVNSGLALSFYLYYDNTSGGTYKYVYISGSNPKFTVPADYASFRYYDLRYRGDLRATGIPDNVSLYEIEKDTTTTTEEYSDYTTGGGEGGGTSGNGNYKGTQSSAGGNGGFGYGANQETDNYMYCGGAGGGGWYGGGTYHADGSTGSIYDGSGGSGFVNTAANASYRPSGYTGLQLDSGSTTAGNSSHPSINGGTEIGHSGNGYARITVIN